MESQRFATKLDNMEHEIAKIKTKLAWLIKIKKKKKVISLKGIAKGEDDATEEDFKEAENSLFKTEE